MGQDDSTEPQNSPKPRNTSLPSSLPSKLQKGCCRDQHPVPPSRLSTGHSPLGALQTCPKDSGDQTSSAFECKGLSTGVALRCSPVQPLPTGAENQTAFVTAALPLEKGGCVLRARVAGAEPPTTPVTLHTP